MGEKGQTPQKTTLWTPANVVTCIRVVLVPLWLLLAELVGPAAEDAPSWGGMAVFVCFVVLSLTDKLDGYLARSRNEVTTFGKFLDPIADKLAVVVALCYLLEYGEVSSWVLLVVVGREFLVSGLRMVVASKGQVVAASNLGKWKTATTMTSICGILLSDALAPSVFSAGLLALSYVVLLVAVVFTIWSGVDYFIKCWPYVKEA
ncbi:MAG: CDP-diacylglycerol--glycerol-3-phosphate 3-phosphatidyltransferase [Tractidigestivibacter sp.]|jgi:CDP-diacylglycerol--glycerol-3-phosphate 3-phosphatidyltransferase|uniref:CDP-diacylglycerol--glycerol-3-phosphate 3-phosphatidyltransferase n=1 Tax=Tractidigestivibacter sp. TaxID=2847320 RepID=UPI003D8CFEBD